MREQDRDPLPRGVATDHARRDVLRGWERKTAPPDVAGDARGNGLRVSVHACRIQPTIGVRCVAEHKAVADAMHRRQLGAHRTRDDQRSATEAAETHALSPDPPALKSTVGPLERREIAGSDMSSPDRRGFGLLHSGDTHHVGRRLRSRATAGQQGLERRTYRRGREPLVHAPLLPFHNHRGVLTQRLRHRLQHAEQLDQRDDRADGEPAAAQ
jgi:hypothetical protein